MLGKASAALARDLYQALFKPSTSVARKDLLRLRPWRPGNHGLITLLAHFTWQEVTAHSKGLPILSGIDPELAFDAHRGSVSENE